MRNVSVGQFHATAKDNVAGRDEVASLLPVTELREVVIEIIPSASLASVKYGHNLLRRVDVDMKFHSARQRHRAMSSCFAVSVHPTLFIDGEMHV